jgi:hypothetical protein
MDDPDDDRKHGSRGVDQGCPALLLDGGLESQRVLEPAVPRFPPGNARHQESSDRTN